ncbi:MAG: hypothetical protein LBG71_03675 [Clostridiales Family XIII bacterium]|jgi:hypothetical protein|nr:hypothetical protein [Clostridiales Family XIII bacterium]
MEALYKVALPDLKKSKIADLGDIMSALTVNFSGNKLYYSTFHNTAFGMNTKLHVFDMETEKNHKTTIPLLNKHGPALTIIDYVIGDKIFRNENGKLFVMDPDGNNCRPWGE